MPITPPTNEDLAEIARRYRLGLDAGDIESFRAIIGGALASYDEVERLYSRAPARRPGPALPVAGRGRERTGRLVRHHRAAGRPPTARWPGAGSRSRTTSRWPACR